MTECISVFDMLKIGVGPSSSHTLGPWRAVQRWLREALPAGDIEHVQVQLFGSLALTGRGHCTDTAIGLALLGEEPETVEVDAIPQLLASLRKGKRVTLPGQRVAAFDPDRDIEFHQNEVLPQHPNGMTCRALQAGRWFEASYFSVGGGFVVAEGDAGMSANAVSLPYPCQHPRELIAHCDRDKLTIAEMVHANELCWRDADTIDSGLRAIWAVMLQCIHRGCHSDGRLPGGLQVLRRAPALFRKLMVAGDLPTPERLIDHIRAQSYSFGQIMQWVSCFALAVNEENASLGRVVTAPTNGAAGVIPAVLMYHLCFALERPSEVDIFRFLMVAGEIGTHFKKGATISAAMGGCQAEIGVSSAMAAAALAEAQGGTVRQALMAAEIAMEHHLGMTCDPVGGLVQVPCIERNAMGAVKAINAAELALASDPYSAKVSLDQVIRTMAETARDMSTKYKETSQGGLAVNIAVNVPEC